MGTKKLNNLAYIGISSAVSRLHLIIVGIVTIVDIDDIADTVDMRPTWRFFSFRFPTFVDKFNEISGLCSDFAAPSSNKPASRWSKVRTKCPKSLKLCPKFKKCRRTWSKVPSWPKCLCWPPSIISATDESLKLVTKPKLKMTYPNLSSSWPNLT